MPLKHQASNTLNKAAADVGCGAGGGEGKLVCGIWSDYRMTCFMVWSLHGNFDDCSFLFFGGEGHASRHEISADKSG